MVRARPLIAGNWKMNGLKADLREIEAIRDCIGAVLSVDVLICPPSTLLMQAASLAAGTALKIGAQDCHFAKSGAYTGDLSAAMLKDAGAIAIIVGHSERRAGHGETSLIVREKASAAIAAGLAAIICIGETAGERRVGLTLDVCARQLRDSVPSGASPENCIIAYEPVWAIGSGVTPSVSEGDVVHAHVRDALTRAFPQHPAHAWRILYGGSVTPANAESLMSGAHIDGLLVGGASLKAASFSAIVSAAETALQKRSRMHP